MASRSSSATTSATSPAAAQAATVSNACDRPVSISSRPPGASQCAARRHPAVEGDAVRPAVERDPRLVVAGLGEPSGWRYSAGRHVRRVDGQHVDPPAQVDRQHVVEVALEDPRRRRLRRRRRPRPGRRPRGVHPCLLARVGHRDPDRPGPAAQVDHHGVSSGDRTYQGQPDQQLCTTGAGRTRRGLRRPAARRRRPSPACCMQRLARRAAGHQPFELRPGRGVRERRPPPRRTRSRPPAAGRRAGRASSAFWRAR